jgi:predicted RNA binding protein YcfA (HicA-like mRNA interferase family)
VKRHELLDHLKQHGCELHREGGRHSIFTNPTTGAKVPVPRHGEIDNRLARTICKQLEVEPLKGR